MSNWSDLNDKPCDFIWTTARPDVSHGCNLRDGHQGVHVCCSCKVTSALVRCGCCGEVHNGATKYQRRALLGCVNTLRSQRDQLRREIERLAPSSSAPTPETEK